MHARLVVAIGTALVGCGRLDFDALDGIPDLVVRYAMDDDPSGGTALASVPTLDGTCAPCPHAIAGHLGGGYQFDGNSIVVIPSSTLVGAPPYTVTLWIDPPSGGVLVAKPASATNDADTFAIDLFNGQPVFETTSDGMNAEYLSNSPTLPGTWHHVAGSWDGVQKRLYVDGVLVGTKLATIATSSQGIVFGGDLDMDMPANLYNGAMDELRFYARALSDAEIAILAQ